jgi:Leucine-rich repeat (LRR) protein
MKNKPVIALNRIGLISLDLKKNSKLEKLFVNNNSLEILDLSKCKKIKHIECSGNPIKKIILFEGCTPTIVCNSQYVIEYKLSLLTSLIKSIKK